MKIDPTAPQRPASVRRAAASGGTLSDGFAKALAGNSPSAQPSGSSPLGALNAMLALQEVPDALDKRSRAARRGELVLDLLDGIRLGILAGTLTQGDLADLAQVVRDRRDQVDDPDLVEILAEIELRAEVELAKFSRRD